MSTTTMDDERRDTVRLLRESAQSFAVKESPLSRARTLRGCKPDFDRTFWDKLAALGWTGLLLPEQFGGYAQGFAEMAAVTAELAAQVAPEPFTAVATFAGGVLRHSEDTEQKALLLPLLAAGELIPAVAWQDADGNLDITAPRARAVRHGDGVSLTGEKRHIRPGAGCDGYIVSALGDDGLEIYWVPKDTAGLQVFEEQLADGTFSARLRLDGVKLAHSQRLAKGNVAATALSRAYDETVVMVSVELLALSRKMLAMTLEYLRTRVQFGKPIGSFQALQHRSVDLLIQQELTSAVVEQAIAALDDGADDRERAGMASRAKSRASGACLLIARESMQMHGAIGYTDEYDLGLYLQRALALSAWLGNGLAHRRRFAALNPLLGATVACGREVQK
jgi:alkylation response protein AidB-like acyl-CoA dehydrogenase